MKISVNGLGRTWDGDHEFEWDGQFTNRELHTIKRLSGVRAGELEDAYAALDNDLLVALASISLARIGKPCPDEILWAAPQGSVIIDFGDSTEAAGDEGGVPPQIAAVPPNDERESTPLSGETSTESSDPSPNGLKDIGLLGSDISSVSDLETSAA